MYNTNPSDSNMTSYSGNKSINLIKRKNENNNNNNTIHIGNRGAKFKVNHNINSKFSSYTPIESSNSSIPLI